MKKNNDLGFLIQALLCVSAVIFYIISIFEKSFLNASQILFSLALFAIAYNNHKIYKRKYFTILYIAFGLILFLGAVINIIK